MTLTELNQHLELREKLAKAQELLASLRDAATPGAAKLTGMPHAPGVNDKVGDLAVEIADMDARIEYLQAEIQASESGILTFISGVNDDQARMAFRLRFIRGLSWKEVSAILGKYTSESSVKSACYRFLREPDEEEHAATPTNAL